MEHLTTDQKDIGSNPIEGTMCLYIKDSVHKRKDDRGTPYPLVSKTNKVTYKVLRNYDGKPHTPFRQTQTDTFEMMSADSFGITVPRWSPAHVGAGIHSYKTLIKAQLNSSSSSIVVKCMVPAGTPYYVGKNGDIVSLILILGSAVDKDGKEVEVAGRAKEKLVNS